MVVGKLLILFANPTLANDLQEPRFFEYRNGSIFNNVVDISFGWFKTLEPDEKDAYHQALTHAVNHAENGEKVSWYRGQASGVAVPVMTWPSGAGYCRKMHIQTIAYNTQKHISATACYDEPQNRWIWYSDK
jgi:surface antigen